MSEKSKFMPETSGHETDNWDSMSLASDSTTASPVPPPSGICPYGITRQNVYTNPPPPSNKWDPKDLVQVIVGQRRAAAFNFHRPLLASSAQFFDMTINRCTCGARCHEAIKIPWIEPVIFSEFISWVYGYAILHYVPVDQQSLTLCKLWVLGAQLRCLRLQDDVIYFFAENISDLVLLNHGDLPLLPVETIQYVYTNTNYGNGLRRFLVDYTLYTMDKEVFEQTNFRHYHKDFEMELEVRNAEVHPKARRWEKLGKLLDGEHLQTYFVCKDRR